MTIQSLDNIVVRSPYDGRELGSLPAASAAEVASAIARAHAAQPRWAATPLDERVEMLRRARGVLVRRKEEIARLVSAEQGKPVLEAVLSEVMTSLNGLTYYVNHAAALLADAPRAHRVPFLADKKARLIVTPRGVASILPAWNYPFSIPVCQVAANLVAGNVTLLRPSTSTPLAAVALAEMFWEAGVPRDVLQLVICRTDQAEALVSDPRVRLLLFTGSTSVGRALAEKAAKNLTRVVLELGGKDPLVVFDDAPLERAARAAVWSSFMNAGQNCSSTERVYVQRGVLGPFTDRVVALTRQLVVGNPDMPGTDIGPMANDEGVARAAAHVHDAVAKGARVLVGGQPTGGRFFPPTVLADVTHDMQVMREETFGPLLPIMAFDTEDEAVALCNDSEYALTAAVFTSDRARAARMQRQVEAGIVGINDAPSFTLAEVGSPWGGPKNSGLGRTHGPEGFSELVEVKYVTEDWSMRDKQLWWFPYAPGKQGFFMRAIDGMFAPSIVTRVASLTLLLPWFPLLAREANLPVVLSHVPQMLRQ